MRKLAIWGATVGVACGIALLSLSNAQSQPPTCVEQWYNLSDAERIQCTEAVGGGVPVAETLYALDAATANAFIPVTPSLDIAQVEATYEAIGYPTAKPTIQPGVIPGNYMIVTPVAKEDLLGTSESYRYNTSVWRVGAIIGANGSAEKFFVATPLDTCAIRTFASNGPGLTPAQNWLCPEDIGEISITGATGPTGIVSFAAMQGDTGTFDLNTKEWTRNGQPWMAIPTPTTINPYPYPYPQP